MGTGSGSSPIIPRRRCLPSSWYTLYQLSKLPEATLTKALSNGTVHPGMERREVATLRNGLAPREAEEAWTVDMA